MPRASNSRNYNAPRSGLSQSVFAADDKLHRFCMQRFHEFMANRLPDGLTLEDGPLEVHDYDALLNSSAGLRRVEYKWDRYKPNNWAAEVIAKDRGDDLDPGYMLKRDYDWLAYIFVNHGVGFFFEAQAVREYVFNSWNELKFAGAHTANRNKHRTCSWNLLVPVKATLAELAPKGQGFKVQFPASLFDMEAPAPSALEGDLIGHQIAEVLAGMAQTTPQAPWTPTAANWDGLADSLVVRDQERFNFRPREIDQSLISTVDWTQHWTDLGFVA
jgi:hypothetical protein